MGSQNKHILDICPNILLIPVLLLKKMYIYIRCNLEMFHLEMFHFFAFQNLKYKLVIYGVVLLN